MLYALLLPVTAAASFVLAAETGTSVESWFERGVLGLVVAAFIFRQIVPGATYREEKAERERQQKVFEEKVLPALITFNNWAQEQLKRAASQ